MSVRSGKQKSGQQGPSQSSQKKGTMVPFPVNTGSQVSQVNPVNKLQVIGTIPKPYSSVLASQPKPVDPFGCSLDRPNPTPNSPYLPVSQQNLFHIEPHMKFKDDPVKLAAQFFPPGWHFTPQFTFKSLSFYKDILVQTESVHIKPITDRNDSTKAIYHSLYIKKIIVMSDWGNHPSDMQQLDNQDHQFNYYDYIEAWDNIFLYQNQSFGHSWFVQFDQKFKSHFPIWFNRWWTRHGSDLEIFPQELENAITHFSCKAPRNPQFDSVPITLQFVSKYKVPWILKWQYEIHIPTIDIQFKDDQGNASSIINVCPVPTIVRMWFIKWWDKVDVSKIVSYVLKEFPIKSVVPVKSIKGSSSKSKEVTSGSGLFDISDIQNCSAEEAKLIAQALRRRTDRLQEEASAASSSESVYEDDDEQFTINLQDAQDPFA